jgi:putative membrane protein
MMWDGYGGGGGVAAWFMLFFMIVFIAAIVVGIVFLVRALGTGGGMGREEPRRRDEAREILRRRYANGEIDREEYLRRRQDLDDDG